MSKLYLKDTDIFFYSTAFLGLANIFFFYGRDRYFMDIPLFILFGIIGSFLLLLYISSPHEL